MWEDLSPREREIFDLLVQRVSPKEIAFRLNINYTTVCFHRDNLYKKLNVHNIKELRAKHSANDKAIPIEPSAETPVAVSKKKMRFKAALAVGIAVGVVMLAFAVLFMVFFRKPPAYLDVAPIGTIIPAYNLGLSPWTDKSEGGSSTTEIFITSEKINGVVYDNVLNIKINLVKRENSVIVYANATTKKYELIQRLRQANGIRFKARGDGKSWYVEFLTKETTQERNYARYSFVFGTVRNKIVVVDVPYSKLTLPEWYEQYSFDFNKETIREMMFSQALNLQEYGSFSLQIFDFEVY